MFDVKIVINVKLGSPTLTGHAKMIDAFTHINLREDATHKRWHVHGMHDPRFPGSGPYWLKYRRAGDKREHIILQNKFGHDWAELQNFPEYPMAHSRGSARTWNLHYPACQYTGDKSWWGNWWVNQHVKQSNLPLVDLNDSYIRQAITSCTRDTGWRFDTSSGIGGSVSIVAAAGGGYTDLVIKRKEPGDARRWDLRIGAAGVGVATPGIGSSGSVEALPSVALTEVRAGPDGKNPFPVSDFAGTVLFFDASAGVGVSKAGAGGSATTFMFIGGVHNDGIFPDCTSMKAVLQIASSSGGGSNSKTKVGFGAGGLIYGGVCSVKQR